MGKKEDINADFKRVLFPTDFSAASKHALKYAISIADRYNARLHMLHVIDETAETIGFYVPHLTFDNLGDEMKKSAEGMLERLCIKHLEGRENIVSTVISGVPDRDIVKFAEENNIDVIVMGCSGKSGLDRLFFGSTTERVLRKSPCPVLTIHPPKESHEIIST